MSEQATGFAAAFNAILSLFGILPTGKLATAPMKPSLVITGGSDAAPTTEESPTESR